jgi:hypothetical protein
MASKGYTAVKGRRVRVTRVDSCGRPVFGEDSQAVSKGFISVAWTANTVESDEINQPNAAGERCIYEPAVPELTGYTLNMTFCEVDPELFSLVTGQRVYYDGDGNAIGIAVSTDISLEDQAFALEVWAGAPAGDGCSTEGAQGSYGYFLAPFLKGGILGDYTIENGAVTFTIQGATTRNGNAWGRGPYNVMLVGGVPAPLIDPLQPNDHKLMIWVGVAPPEPFYGTRPVLDPTETPVTAVVAAEGASPMEVDFTFTGGTADAPVYIEFGDGEWDYVENGTLGASHVYAADGTYAVRASSNGTWVTTEVTIPQV